MKKATLLFEYDTLLTFAKLSIAVNNVLLETGGKVLKLEEGDLTATGPTAEEIREQETLCPFCQADPCICSKPAETHVPPEPTGEFVCPECKGTSHRYYKGTTSRFYFNDGPSTSIIDKSPMRHANQGMPDDIR